MPEERQRGFIRDIKWVVRLVTGSRIPVDRYSRFQAGIRRTPLSPVRYLLTAITWILDLQIPREQTP
jgi:hypothetical protein